MKCWKLIQTARSSSKTKGNKEIMQKECNGKICYPYHLDPIPEFFYQKAKKELNETPETKEEEFKKLKDLLSADNVTCDIEFEKDFLHQFLRHRKYDSSKAFQYLQKYLNFRKSHSSLFQSVPDKYMNENVSAKWINILPYRCPDGCTIVLMQLGKCSPNDVSLEYFRRQFMSVFLQALRNPMSQINGFKMIYDFQDTFKLMRFCTPQNIFLAYNAAMSCIPGRYKEMHLINKSIFLMAAHAVLKYALPEKLRKRFIFHSSPEDLLNYFPKSIIPTEYGGSLNDFEDAELIRKINKDHGNFPEGGQPNYF